MDFDHDPPGGGARGGLGAPGNDEQDTHGAEADAPEAPLRASEEHLRGLYEAMTEGACFHRIDYDETGSPADYTILDVNPAYTAITGLTRESAVGERASELYGATPPPYLDTYARVVETGEPTRFHVYYEPMGKHFAISVFQAGRGQFATVFEDVTAKVATEDALRHERDVNEEILAATHSLIVLLDPEGRIEVFNHGCERTTGYAAAEVVGRSLLDTLLAEEERDSCRQVLAELVSTGVPSEHMNYWVTKHGDRRLIAWSNTVIHDADGHVRGILGTGIDVTEQHRAEQALRESEQRLRAFFEHSPVGLAMWTAADPPRYSAVNRVIADLNGRPMAAHAGRTPLEVIPSERHATETTQAIREVLRTGRPTGVDSAIPKADGGTAHVNVAFFPVASGGGPPLAVGAMVLDTTQHHEAELVRLDLEQQLRQAQRMEAVGQLAGGVAHDFNNLLQVIVGYADMAIGMLDPSAEAKPLVGEILTAAERASTLVRQLLAFSRRQVLELAYLDLNTVMSEVVGMIRRIIGEHIILDVVAGHNLGTIHADRGQMEQVIMNLCVNARDAMPEGGRLTIETENIFLDAQYCATHAWARPGRFVLLQITDTGRGMDAATLDRIFEPFFTTKSQGEGTGLGLAVVYGIVRQHQGMIQAYSESGKGTSLKVYVPMVERSATSVGTKITGRAPRGTETILVAEDEESVRVLARRVLEAAGYTVLVASDGDEALALFREHESAIDLLFLDVVMPSLGGRAVYDQARGIRREMRCLFASGYSQNAIHTSFVLDAGMNLLRKPYSVEALLHKVREVLDAP
jgi:two-component system, cell cycle sensor histidine kinase and response regulator CckA